MITQYGYSTEFCETAKRNVIDAYKQWTDEEIKADLQKNRLPIVSIFMNVGYNINIASGIRAHNAFLGKEVYIVGRKKWDRRGSISTHRYETVYHADGKGFPLLCYESAFPSLRRLQRETCPDEQGHIRERSDDRP